MGVSAASSPGVEAPVVLITGALTGIGRATAVAFARAGARVVVSGRRPDVGFALAEELRSGGAAAEFVAADVRLEEDVVNLVDRALTCYGSLDVAVNNAGTEGKRGPLTELTTDDYEAIFDTNVLGLFLCMKYELRVMLRQSHGSIVNISSIYGSRGAPTAALYAASKHAVEGLTQAAALEVADTGIRINAIAPGLIDTGMLERFSGTTQAKKDFVATEPVHRAGRPEEIADAVVFAASDRASFMTGTTLAVDGGLHAR
jgi:NAD(P)-dependent dehydrogenase (short-subunit alcohol dehydrogenase family)